MKVTACPNQPILNTCDLPSFNYQIDPYIGCEHFCRYCYALSNATTDWTQEISVHEDIVRQLNDELETIPPQTIYFGYQTDPYQPLEADYRQTRKVLKLLNDRGFSASILTKSDLVTRDIDILQEMDNASVSVSVAFNDSKTRQLFEANTIDTEKRINALRQIKEAGINTGALICPVIPYLTDPFRLIEMLAPYADTIWIYGLSIPSRSEPSWSNVETILDQHYRPLKKQIETVLFSSDPVYWSKMRGQLERLRKDHDLNLEIHV